LHGKTISYHENGKLKGQAEYNLGVLDGNSIEWTKDGIVINSVRFDSGRLEE
jgi:antitoxin component YwqK of YwqJK toxin-antitoxin module